MKFPWPKGQVSPGSCSGLDRPSGTCRGGKFSLSGSLTSERQKWPSLPRQPPPAQGCSLPLGGHGQHLCTWLSLWTAWSPLAAWEIVNEKWVCELLSLTPPGINTSLLSFSSLAPTGLTLHYFAHRVRIWAKSSRPCLCSSVLFILRIPCRLLTTDSIPTTKWHGRGQGSGLAGFFTAFQERWEALDSTYLLAALMEQSWQVELMGQDCEIFEGRPLSDSSLSPQTQHNP